MSKEAQEPQKFGLTASTLWSNLLSALSGALLLFIGQWLTAKEPHLTKLVSEIVPFRGDKGEVGIINIRINNDGNKGAEDVEGRVQIPDASIEEVKIVPEIIHAEKLVKNDALEIKVKLLNPNTSLQVSALVRK